MSVVYGPRRTKPRLQQRALALPCPMCGGVLRKQGRDLVRCIRCWNAYPNRKIVDRSA